MQVIHVNWLPLFKWSCGENTWPIFSCNFHMLSALFIASIENFTELELTILGYAIFVTLISRRSRHFLVHVIPNDALTMESFHLFHIVW